MRRRLILFGSVGLNVALAAGLVLFARHHLQQSQSPEVQPAVSNVVHTHVVVRKQFFSWDEVESADYPTYIANLRQVGCPEQTIRDIIVADVDQLYARKRADVPTPEQEWWHYDPNPELAASASAKLASLEQERQDLLTTLLGSGWTASEVANINGISLAGPVLGDLSPETKHAVLEAVARSQQRTQAYIDAQKLAGKAPSPTVLARLAQQMRSELSQILNPGQLEEFLLRYSDSAASLRSKLRAVQVTPDEFRAMFRQTDPLEQTLELAEEDAVKTNLQSSTDKQIESALKTVLGPDRYQAYLLSQDPAYQQALAMAEDYGDLSPKEIQALFQINKASEQEQQRIKDNVMLTPEQKDAQLAIVERQQQAATDQVLGVTPEGPPLPPLPPPPAQIHAYRAEETVDMIAAQYPGVSPSAILSANPNLNFHLLAPGTPIRIPAPPSQ